MTRSDLEYIRHLNDLIYGGCMHIAELKSKAYPGAIQYDDTGASKPAPTNKLERVFEQVDAEERRINKLIDKRYELKSRALHEIKNADMECAAKHILYLRYLSKDPLTGDNLSWSDVYRYINRYHNIQKRRIFQLHHDAVRKLQNHNI